MYARTTHDIKVIVKPEFLDEQSDPDNSRYVWAYHVRIENDGRETVQLMSRHWRITDANGTTQEVQGAGVVGEQPMLKPGTSFEYTSGAPLATPSGFMVGRYHMVSETGERFEVDIPAFSLDCPHMRPQIH